METFVLTNARVYTMDAARPRAGSVAVAGGRIVALDRPAPAGTQPIDCRGGVLLPGFIDPHLHLLAAAAARCSVDCSPRALRSITAIQEALAAAAAGLPPGEWVRATGYDESALAEGRHPTRWDLDAAVSDRPVRLLHRSGHAAVLNSAALALVGITIASEEPPGAVIERRAGDGEPAGLLIEMDAVIERVVPPLPPDALVAGMRASDEQLVRAGVTAVQDMTHRNDPARLALLERVCAAAGFRPRQLPPATAPGVAGEGPVKLMPAETGPISPAQRNRLIDAVVAAHERGRQVAVHAVTEGGVRLALDAIEAALARAPRGDHRHRIEHASICPPAAAERAAALGVIVVSNPVFLYERGDHYRASVAATDLPNLYAVGALDRAGVRVAAASDAPVAPPEPLASIRAAIHRRSATGRALPGAGVRPETALASVTYAAAFSAFAETNAGVLAPGMPADLVLLDRDPTEDGAPPTVWWTVLNGEIVYAAPGAPRFARESGGA